MNYDRINTPVRRYYCSYNGCSSDSVTTNGGAISFFGFPKDTERCSKWITNSGREEFRFLNPRELSGKKICELHFAPSAFSNQFKTNLKKSAFPMNWKNAIPELIQIDDDDEDDEVESEHGIGDEIEAAIANGTNVQELTDRLGENEQNNLNSTVSNSPFNTNQINGNLNSGVSSGPAVVPVDVVSSATNTEPLLESQPLSTTVTSSTTIIEENPKTSSEKASSKSSQTPADKTKFHNLPTQTTQGEFYYQQCPSVEETNHSFPEPPDGEMPLFVQQNSVVSMAEEVANSESSEPPSKKRKRDREVDLSAQMNDAMKYLKDITELLTTSEDEFELFGKSVALQLKKMSLCTALTVQAKIQQVLSQYRIKDIKKKVQNNLDESSAGLNGNCDKSEGEQEEDILEKQTSPQLSLDCTSELSDDETGHEKN